DKQGRLWQYVNDCTLKYLEDGQQRSVSIHNCPHRPEISDDGDVWLGNNGGSVRYWNGADWFYLNDLALAYSSFISIKAVGPRQAICVYTEKALLVSFNGTELEAKAIDFPNASLAYPQWIVHANANEDYWFINKHNLDLWYHKLDMPLKRVGQLAVAPASFEASFNDRFGRLWVKTRKSQLYTLSGNQWKSFEQLFPDAPLKIKQLAFRTYSEPIVTTYGSSVALDVSLPRIPSGTYFKKNQNWHLLSSAEDTTALHQQDYNRLFVDSEERVWALNSDSLDVWADQQHTRIGQGNFFPDPGSFRDIQADKNGTIHLIMNDGMIIYNSYYDYHFVSYDQMQADETSNPPNHIHGIDCDGYLWVSRDFNFAKWKNGKTTLIAREGMEEISTFDVIDKVLLLENGQLWASLLVNDRRVLYFDDSMWYEISHDNYPLPKVNYREAVKDKSGNIWLIVNNGMFHVRDNNAIPITPSSVSGQQNLLVYPNPAQHYYTINWQQQKQGETTIRLYNSLGQFIRELHTGNYATGNYKLDFYREQLSSGTYIIEVENEGLLLRKKMIIH
ncbi:MAG: T9SS type A sorting domain-containing protein, partial [Bacteroidota bacterium]